MSCYYVDSSALTKRYAAETGSAWFRALCDPAAGHVIGLAGIGVVEVSAALGRKVLQGYVQPSDAPVLLASLRLHALNEYLLIDVVTPLIDLAVDLAQQHTLRGYDAVHLAAAMTLRDDLRARGLTDPGLIASDLDLLAAAQAEGFSTDDPNNHP